jgi:hypothetical protein
LTALLGSGKISAWAVGIRGLVVRSSWSRQDRERAEVSQEQAVSHQRLAELEVHLARLSQAWEAWDEELGEEQERLEQGGMDRLKAADVVHRRQVDGFRAGTAPFDLRELYQLLDELCGLYLRADREERLLIRGFFNERARMMNYLHSYVGGRAARLVRSTGDTRWLALGLAAASINDQRVDYRDLLISLGKLWLAAEEVGIAPARHFSAAARISSREPVYGNRCTADLLRGFRTSAHLKSIKRAPVES